MIRLSFGITTQKIKFVSDCVSDNGSNIRLLLVGVLRSGFFFQ